MCKNDGTDVRPIEWYARIKNRQLRNRGNVKLVTDPNSEEMHSKSDM